MIQNTIMFSILAVIATVIVCFVVSTFLPGIERKYVHARIQQRIGPPVTSPGIMAPIKFAFKKNVDVVHLFQNCIRHCRLYVLWQYCVYWLL